MDSLTEPEIWPLSVVSNKTGISRSLIYRLMDEGRFPRSVPIAGTRRRGWNSHRVQEWINHQLSKQELEGVA